MRSKPVAKGQAGAGSISREGELRPPHRFSSCEANALRTFDWEIPNCRAIREGVMPALKAARTAFS
jgi:hypothetical protein